MMNRRDLLLGVLPLAFSLGCASKSGSSSNVTDIQLIGIESLDSLFREAKSIDQRLDAARTALRDGKNSLNSALGLKDGTPFTDALNDLASKAKGKVKLLSADGGLALSVSDAVPSNVQAAVDSLNNTLASYKTALLDLGNIKGDVESLVSASKALPDQIQKDFKSLGIGITELPAALRTARDNVRIIGNMPTRVEKIGTAMKANVTAVTTAFGGPGGGKGSGGGGNSGGGNTSSGSGGTRTLGR